MSQPALAEPPSLPTDITNVDDLAARLGISAVEDAPVEDSPPPADGGTPGDAPPPGEAPPAEAPKASPNAEAAARRVAEKKQKQDLTQELETARARLQELEALSAKLPEVEKSATEFRTLAEQREAELKAYTERYQNEQNTLDPSLLDEIPDVKEAQERYNTVATKFFPKDLSDPNVDEIEIRLNPATLSNQSMQQIRQQIDYWKEQEFNSKADPASRAVAQHIAISNIALAMGADKSKFQTKTFQGADYELIPRNHPVYAHLSAHLPQLVEAQEHAGKVRSSMLESKVQALETVKNGRMNNTRKMMEGVGVGLTGEALDAALQKNPDSPVLKAMKLVESDPELVSELKREIDMEVLVNGHLRPHLDLTDPDPKSYTQKAQAMYTRIGQRAVHAPLAPVLMKMALKQSSEIAQLKEELAAVKAERDKTLIQNEPGGVVTSGNGAPPPGSYDDPILSNVASRLGL